MDQQQIMVVMPLLAVIVVFVGGLFLALRFLNFVQTIILELVRPGSTTPVPATHPPPQPPPPAPAPTTSIPWDDLLKKALAAAPKPSAPAIPIAPGVTPSPSAPGVPLWYTLGLKDVGFHEVGDNRGIETFIAQAHVGALGDPWCAIWVNAKLEQAGVQGTRSASSQSFVTSPMFVELDKPKLGCIVVYWRGSRSSGLGHAGFYVSETATSINTLGGNESDSVKIEALPKSSPTFGVVGFYWPKSVPVPNGLPVAAPADSLSHIANPIPVTATATAFSGMTGKMSVFGGPDDKGVSPSEGLALCEPSEISKFDGYFLPAQPPGTTGLARRLDPGTHYIACRWDYKQTSRPYLQGITVGVSANGKMIQARPVDWGPNVNTGRICDMSPGLAAALGLKTDDTCTVTIPIPAAEPAVT